MITCNQSTNPSTLARSTATRTDLLLLLPDDENKQIAGNQSVDGKVSKHAQTSNLTS